MLRRSTVFFSGVIFVTSQPVRTSMAYRVRNTRSFATSRLDSFSITPPTW
jgi:hypothetical protein